MSAVEPQGLTVVQSKQHKKQSKNTTTPLTGSAQHQSIASEIVKDEAQFPPQPDPNTPKKPTRGRPPKADAEKAGAETWGNLYVFLHNTTVAALKLPQEATTTFTEVSDVGMARACYLLAHKYRLDGVTSSPEGCFLVAALALYGSKYAACRAAKDQEGLEHESITDSTTAN